MEAVATALSPALASAGRDSDIRALMLVSARADRSVREDVAAGLRPCPEYLRLEARHGVELVDLSRVASASGRRTPARSLRHVVAAMPRIRDADVVLSDGEHVGIPLALALRHRRHVPHVVIGHHLTTAAKTAAFRVLHAHRGMTRILVHSDSQRDAALRRLRLPDDFVRIVPYGVDLDFWRALDVAEEQLILSPGREHRDLATLAAATAGRPERVVGTGFSPHSSRARRRQPDAWPANFSVAPVDILTLRLLYARAALVVVPVLPTDFPAGITTVVEAMAMGKPVIVSATRGLEGVVTHGRTGVLVRPGDVGHLAATVAELMADPARRAELGARARDEAQRRYGLDDFADRLAAELREAAQVGGRVR
jgi:glycosyltransferase involved in cell wall biosynthesis